MTHFCAYKNINDIKCFRMAMQGRRYCPTHSHVWLSEASIERYRTSETSGLHCTHIPIKGLMDLVGKYNTHNMIKDNETFLKETRSMLCHHKKLSKYKLNKAIEMLSQSLRQRGWSPTSFSGWSPTSFSCCSITSFSGCLTTCAKNLQVSMSNDFNQLSIAHELQIYKIIHLFQFMVTQVKN